MRLIALLGLWCAAMMAGCGGGTTGQPDAAAVDGALTDARAGDGGMSCGRDMILVRPCCGGALPQCEAPLDGGGCAPGAATGQCSSGAGGFQTGCVRQCTPPAPFCAPIPSGCGATPSCGCFPTSPCPSSSCGLISNGQMQCLCA